MTVSFKSLNLDQLAEQIRPHLNAVDKAEESALVHARDAGGWLKLAKRRCQVEGHPWNKWVPENFEKSKQMADGYIRIFDRFPKIEAEIARTGKGMSVRAAIDFLAAGERQAGGGQEGDGDNPPAEKKKPPIKLSGPQQEALEALLAARGVHADPASYLSSLADLDINPKKIISRLDIMAQERKEQELGQWLNSFQDGSPAWEDACQPFGLDPDPMAHAAYLAGQRVMGWHRANDGFFAREEYDTLIAGNGWGWYYFVQGATFVPDDLARRAAAWLAEHGDNRDIELDGEQVQKLRDVLAALPPVPPVAQTAEGQPAPGEARPGGSASQTAEPAPAGEVTAPGEPRTASPKRKRG